MAMIHAIVRWSKARLCTGFLFIVLCAVAWFALSASYHSLNSNPASNSDDEIGGQLQGHSLSGEPAQFDDDDVQYCKYPLETAAETYDAWDASHDLETCSADPENLFYVDSGRLMTYDKVLDGKRLDRCEFRGIVWRSDSEFDYTDALVLQPPSFDVDIDHDFVHVQCYLEHRRGGQTTDSEVRRKGEALREALNEVGHQDSQGRSRRDVQETEEVEEKNVEEKKDNKMEGSIDSEAKHPFRFHNVKEFHRSVVQQNAPRHVGSLGLPDFRDNFVGDKRSKDPAEMKDLSEADSNHQFADGEQNDEDRRNTADGDDHQNAKQFADPSRTYNTQEGRKQTKVEENEEEEEEEEVVEKEEKKVEKEVEKEEKKEEEKEEKKVEKEEHPQSTYLHQSTRPSFDQFLVQVSEKAEVLNRVTNDVRPFPTSIQMNVLLLAIDSVSGASFERNFPRSSNFLLKELKAVVMNGYNSVGDAAIAAVIPLITGLKEKEIRQMGRSGQGGQYVDLLSLVWNKFEQSGYVTMYAEDQPSLGTFQTHYYGFEDVPVDHYMRPFWLAASASDLNANSQPNCLGSVPKHQYTLEYLADFFRKYSSTPKFAFGFLSEFNQSQLVDDDLATVLDLLKKGKHLENTLVVVLGDHGKSYGPLRNTIAGKLEESLPYLSLAFPAGFRSKYGRLMTNLKTNRDRLTTAFDVHKTLMTLLDINSTQLPVNATSRAISLLQEIPRQRTCMTAEVDVHWCTCVKFQQTNDLETTGKRLASFAVQEINRLLDTQDSDKRCDKLSLASVLDVRVVFTNEVVMELENKLVDGQSQVFNLSQAYPLFARYRQVVFTTTPGDGRFEATVVSSAASPSGSVVDGQISRINAYGRESDCIFTTHPDLRKYCHCNHA